MKIVQEMYPFDEEDIVKFWKSSTSWSSSGNFLSIFQHCKIGHFYIVWLLSL